MAILWAGGEDHEFQAGSGLTVTTGAGHFRSGYGRCAIFPTSAGTVMRTAAVISPGVTSFWLSAQLFVNGTVTTQRYFGLTKGVTDKGIYIGIGSSSTKWALFKWDGTTQTLLASETGTSITYQTLQKVDINVLNFGVSATIKVYSNGALLITFTGDASVAGISDLDTVTFFRSGAHWFEGSEIVITDTEDTRATSLVTLAPNAAGTTDQWTGAYTDVNETTLSDATVNVTNTVAQDQLYALADLPAGNFAVRAMVLSARATSPAGSTASQLSLGVRSGSSTDVAAPVAPGTGFLTVERVMDTDPTTGLQWTPTTVNAVQLAMRSA